MSHKPVMAEICMNCGWQEQSKKQLNPRRQKCPECEAPFNNYWVERIYAYNGGGRPSQSGGNDE